MPAVLIAGPRAVGKTTSAQRVAREVVRLDDPAVRSVAAANPDALLRRVREPVLLDEWQEVPDLIGAVKRAVDADPKPGRFLLAGSVVAPLTTRMWPGTGRVIQLVLHCLSQREIAGRVGEPGFVRQLLGGGIYDVGMPDHVPDLDGYVEIAIRGGFPEPSLRLTQRDRGGWYDSYVEHLVSRDVAAIGERRDPVRLRAYLEVLALSTAGMPTDATLQQAAGINNRTAVAYDSLLQNLFVSEPVPAWSTNRLSRLVKKPKRYLVDTGFTAGAARITAADVLRNADLLGRLLDTFVVQQLRPEFALAEPPIRLYHLRTTPDRHEVDILADLGAGRICGIEVKATSAPRRKDATHLIWLRDQYGEDFVRGVVFHTGPQPFELDERIWAIPICALWA